MTAPIPAAECIADRVYGGKRAARVLCPWCSRLHLHPWPTDPATVFVGHCGKGEYTISTK